MTRWLLTGAVAAVAWGGSAAGQAPRSVPAATDGRHVIVLKAAGRPDSKVQVLRSWRATDGKVMTEVKDLATGEVFTMSDINPGGEIDAPPKPVPPPATPVPPAPLPAGPMKPSEQMRADIAQYVQDLKAHPRPSVRMDAAVGLAGGRYASKNEVKQALAAAAQDDPAGVVRAQCIACLSQLGYAEPGHVRRLHAWGSDRDPAVRAAAQAAMARLAPKK